MKRALEWFLLSPHSIYHQWLVSEGGTFTFMFFFYTFTYVMFMWHLIGYVGAKELKAEGVLGRWKWMGIKVGSSCHPLPYSLLMPLLLCTTWFANHRQSGGVRGNPWVADFSNQHTVICIRKINSTVLFFADNVRPKTPPVSISDIQKVRC